jgi:hypothetical protein
MSSSLPKSPTIDEVIYLSSGSYMDETNDLSCHSGHPTLLQRYIGAPVALLDFAIPEHSSPLFAPGQYSELALGKFARAYMLQNLEQYERLVFLSRSMVVILSLILASFVFVWSSNLYGPLAGLFALFLYAFSPNILAHSRLATLDLGFAALTFITSYYYHKLVTKPGIKFLLLAGVSLGLALTTKVSAAFLVPMYGVYVLLVLAIKADVQQWAFLANRYGQRWWIRPVTLILSYLGVLLIAWIVLNLSYGFQGTFRPTLFYMPNLADRLPLPDRLVQVFGQMPLPFPTSYVEMTKLQLKHALQGHPAFLLGEFSHDGWWYYYLIAFLIKVPVTTLLLIVFFLFVTLKDRTRRVLSFSELGLLYPAVSLFLIFSVTAVQIGFRYLLPVLPFLFVLLSRLVTYRFMRHKLIVLLFVSVAVWYLFGTLSIYPHYLAYFNELVGGPENGYKYLVDSNLDWGQDLKGLKQYMTEQGIPKIKLSYFGGADPALYGIDYDYLPSFGLRPSEPDGKWWYEAGYTEDCDPADGVIAISATNLQGVLLRNRDCFQWLRSHEPVSKIGYSIFIYDTRQ